MKKTIATLALAGLAMGGAYLAYDRLDINIAYTDHNATAEAKTEAATAWVAAAPGRVEPRSGEVRLGTTYLGRAEEVLVKIDDKVEEDELMVRLDDAEARARLASAETQAEALREEREKQFVSGREDVRKAEDAIYSAERAITGARIELDHALAGKRAGSGAEQAVTDARKRLKDARDRLERERIAFVKATSKSGLPAPNSAESAVNAARTDVRLAEAVLEKTRIRASMAGNVLQLNVKVGEIVAPSAEVPLIVLGDMSRVRVKAEVDDVDVAKLKVGQKAFVRSVGHPGRDFEGTVSKLAPTLSQPKIGPRGPRRTNDVETLEVTIDLDGAVPLLPGMRVDAFFR